MKQLLLIPVLLISMAASGQASKGKTVYPFAISERNKIITDDTTCCGMKLYYYYWSYNTESAFGWGENDDFCSDRKPTKKEILARIKPLFVAMGDYKYFKYVKVNFIEQIQDKWNYCKCKSVAKDTIIAKKAF